MRVLVAGCGYVGTQVGKELAEQGHEVIGLRRSGPRADDPPGVRVISADLTRPETFAALPQPFQWIIHCAATSGGSPEDYERVYFDGTRNLLDWVRTWGLPPLKYVYTSSTSVYGQDDGSWVTEESPTEPEGETARVLKRTEDLLLNFVRDEVFPAIVLRVGAIYGPDRGYWIKQMLAGATSVAADGERWTNQIHRDDLVQAILASLEKGTPGTIFNAVDEEPVQVRQQLEWLGRALGRPVPACASGLARNSRRGVTNKRVSGERLRKALGMQFKYPTFREGYRAELERQGLRLSA